MSSPDLHPSLEAIPGVTRGLPEREYFLFPETGGLLGGRKLPGLPKGGLIGISGVSGTGKTELVLKFLAANPGVAVAWIEESFTVYPCSFPQHGVGLDRVLFIETANTNRSGSGNRNGTDSDSDSDTDTASPLWVAHQVIKSQVFGVVVLGTLPAADAVTLRRLQLASEKNECSVILLTEKKVEAEAWPFSVQLDVTRDTASGKPVFSVGKFKNI